MDISEHKSGEGLISESEATLRSIYESSPMLMGIVELTADDKIVHIYDNPATSRFFNVEYKGTTNKGATELGAPSEAIHEWLESYRQSQRQGRPARFEYAHPTPNGPLWLSATVSLIGPGVDGRTRFSYVAEDITSRKRTEEALLTSEAFLNAILDQSPFSTWISDDKGTLIRLNEACRNLLNITDEEVVGKYNVLQDNIVKEQGFIPMVRRVFETGEPAGFELRYASSQLKHLQLYGFVSVVLDVTIFPIKDQNGKVTNIVFQHIDITAQKKAEEEKIRLQKRLTRAEKMESLGVLAGGVAHDLNNVLGVVLGYTELLLLKSEKLSPSRPQLEAILKGGHKAAAIVDDLLTLARRGVPKMDVLNLNKIIVECQQSPEFANLLLHHPSVTIKTDLESDLLNISGSSLHISKSIYNLVSNASEAMPKGGAVTIKATNQYLDRPVQGYDKIDDGDYVVLSVSDQGKGIDEKDINRIFEPFYTKKVMGRSGTGLGLAVVWGTVKDHHGYINIQSKENKGSTFTIYFPVTREQIASEHIPVTSSELKGRGESILVVDDVKEQQDIATIILEELNYSVRSVQSGEEALVYLKKNQVDLIVLDMIMDPGIDGLDTFRSVLEIHPKQKAIIVSGFSESDRVKAVLALGAGAYVKKPYVIEKLGLAVKEELDQS